MNAKLSLFLKGFAMGAANVIPGVSGGTVAFVTGIYERLINAIKSFDIKLCKHLLRRDFPAAWNHVDAGFLLPLLLGVFISIISLAKLLKVGFELYPILIASLFFGLITASIFSVIKMVKIWTPAAWVALGIGFILALSLAFVPEASENRGFLYLMLCGAVALCSMIIPGVSGSFVLLLMGNYHLIMIETVNALRKGQWSDVLSIGVPVGLGAITGLLILSRLLSWLFRKFHDVSVSAVSGFVAGSLLLIWPWKRPLQTIVKDGEEKVLSYERYLPSWDTELLLAITIMILGVASVVSVDLLSSREKKY